MTTKATTATGMRGCSGIEPHDTQISDFPVQPSRRDGLGTMCAEHWRAYVRSVAAARKARASAPKAAGLVSDDGVEPTSGAGVAKLDAVVARSTRKRSTRPLAPKVIQAEAIVAEVDALLGPEDERAVGEPDVQGTLETVAIDRSPGSDAGPVAS